MGITCRGNPYGFTDRGIMAAIGEADCAKKFSLSLRRFAPYAQLAS